MNGLCARLVTVSVIRITHRLVITINAIRCQRFDGRARDSSIGEILPFHPDLQGVELFTFDKHLDSPAKGLAPSTRDAQTKSECSA